MNETRKTPEVEFLNLYDLPGEGLVAELRIGVESQLFDREGLQYRIITGNKENRDTSTEQAALARINALARPRLFDTKS